MTHISKPMRIGQPKTTPKQPRWALGIDLGTTHTVVSVQTDRETFEWLTWGENHSRLLPSVVAFLEQETAVGEQADALEHALRSTKRWLGRTPSECDATHPWLDAKVPTVATAQGPKTAIDAASAILKLVYEHAQQQWGELSGAVITIPAYFDEIQRQATLEAAKQANLPVLRLLHEPTAAAIATGLDANDGMEVAVVDLGGGTFDVSVLSLKQGVFKVKATAGDTALGGDDIDDIMANACFGQDYTVAQRQLAKTAKESLWSQASVTLNQHTVTPSWLQEKIEPLLSRMVSLTQSAIDASGTPSIQALLLVGGATRLPLLKPYLQQYFDVPMNQDFDPDTTVAKGAAMIAARLSGHQYAAHQLLLDVNPLSIGVVMMGDVVEKMLWRNTPLPASADLKVTSFQDNQTGFVFNIVQGERDLAAGCRLLGGVRLSGLAPKPAGQLKVTLTLHLDVDGLLSVSAVDDDTGQRVHSTLNAAYQLTPEGVLAARQSAVAEAAADEAEKNRQQQRLKRQQLAQQVIDALAVDGAQAALTDSALALQSLAETCLSVDKVEPDIEQALSEQAAAYFEKRLARAIDKRLKEKVIHHDKD